MVSPTVTISLGSASWRIESSREGITPSVLYPTSRSTSSRSIFTTIPWIRSPSLNDLRVSSIAASSSSAEPMSLIATCAGTFSVLVIEMISRSCFYSGHTKLLLLST